MSDVMEGKEARRYGRDFDDLRERVAFAFDRLTPYESLVLSNAILSAMRSAWNAGYFEASLEREGK